MSDPSDPSPQPDQRPSAPTSSVPTKSPRRPRKKLHIVQLIPNFMTVAALCAGLTAVRFAIEGQFGLAVALILAAAVMDGLDGRLARFLKSESDMGAELDSLCDLVNFGVAPALITYLWALQGMRAEGWIACLIYAVACLLRLARFNIGSRLPDNDSNSFQGVPSPAGALLVMLPMFLAFALDDGVPHANGLVALWMALVGWLMVGRFRTPSFKRATIYAENVSFVLLAFVALVAALLTYPWTTLAIVDCAYLAALGYGFFKPPRKAVEDPTAEP
ncbi:MAG: CDP-diacylglycerol--serine O-phosphatidyltransferase [Cypionkella sp.]|uniref:CDP-diacylglycerol--serine O-phosphatidyltransferase n=1 Tax=Cypionkella sp. TaxID=2811411 RepID=UPI0026128841|nr:CDP-diacylglycerol--serine O-phosphatidyltransferase [Cypionkella sp.]MDB5658381.1 CDP-diacylglycerol--serine O-phosphatidyltransferase [Cypionkella sp.]